MPNLAYTSQQAAIDDLRSRVGQGTSTEILTDADAIVALNAARWEVNRFRPVWYLGSFATVANRQAYTNAQANIPADAFPPARIFYGANGSGAGGCLSCPIFPEFTGANWMLADLMSSASRLRIDPAALDIAARNYAYFQHYFGGRGQQLPDGKVWLDPIPVAVATVWFFARRPRFNDVLGVTEDYAEAYMAFAEFRASMMLAHKQSEAARVTAGFGKQVYTASGATYLKAAREAEGRFYGLLGKPPKLYSV